MIFLFSALVLLIRLHRFDQPTGADGFFYLKQIEGLSGFSGFYYKDYSFAFLPPTLLNFVLRDPLLSYQIAVSLVFGALAWVVDRLVTRGWTERRSLWIFRAVCLLFYSYSLMYLELNLVFLKTSTGLFFLLLACERMQIARPKQAAGALVLAVLSHKLMLVFSLGLVAVWMFQRAGARARVIRNFGIPGVVAAIFVLALVYPRLGHHFMDAWTKMSWDKFLLPSLLGELSLTLYGALLVLAALGLLSRALLTSTSVNEGIESGNTTRFGFPFSKTMILIVAAGLLLPVVFPDGLHSNSISFRLFLVSSPLFILAIGVFARSTRAFQAYGGALMIAMLALNIHFNRPLKTWENPWPRMIPETAALETILPDDALLYAPHGAQFYVAYKTKFRPRSFIIREEPDDKTFRLAYVKPYLRAGTMLQNDLDQMALLKVSKDFYLFKESTWLALMSLHLFRPHAMNRLEFKPDFVANY